jgi:hypothetical protein
MVSMSLALVAQWLEHWSYEPGVGGSNPPLSNLFCPFFLLVPKPEYFFMKVQYLVNSRF